MKKTVIAVSLLACAMGVVHAAPAAATPAKPMNLLVIMLDDLNAMTGAYGGPAITPNMDRLAAQGTRFANAYSVVPACNPSRAALFTSQRPETTGQRGNAGNFRDLPGGESRLTLPQHLMSLGYETVAAGKIFHHGRGKGAEPAPLSDPRSWTEQASVQGGVAGRSSEGTAQEGPGERFSWGPVDQPKEQTGDFQVARYCADYLTRKSGGKPFMLACGISKPHLPHFAPREFFSLYDVDKIQLPAIPPDEMAHIPPHARENFSSSMVRELRKDPKAWRFAVQSYLASTSFADAAVGEILNALDKSPNAANTVVVLMGDHGYHLGDKLRWAKFTLWDRGGRTTLLMKKPGQQPGVVEPAVSFLDLAPTLLKQLGLPPMPAVQGHDLSPLLANPKADWPHAAVSTLGIGSHGVRQGPWNYIRYAQGGEELYNLDADPQEHVNLLAVKPEAVPAGLVQRLAQFIPKDSDPPAGATKPEAASRESQREHKRQERQEERRAHKPAH